VHKRTKNRKPLRKEGNFSHVDTRRNARKKRTSRKRPPLLRAKKEEKLEKEKLAKAITSACNDFRGEPKHTKESM